MTRGGVGDRASGGGPELETGVRTAAAFGERGEGAARQPALNGGDGGEADDESFHGEQPDEADGDRGGLVADEGAETGAGGTEQRTGGDATDQHVGDIDGPGQGNAPRGEPGDGDGQVDRRGDDGEEGAEPGVDDHLGRQEPTAARGCEQGGGDRLVAELAGNAEDAEQERGAGDDRVGRVDELGEAAAVKGRVAVVAGGGDECDRGEHAGGGGSGEGDRREADAALLAQL